MPDPGATSFWRWHTSRWKVIPIVVDGLLRSRRGQMVRMMTVVMAAVMSSIVMSYVVSPMVTSAMAFVTMVCVVMAAVVANVTIIAMAGMSVVRCMVQMQQMVVVAVELMLKRIVSRKKPKHGQTKEDLHDAAVLG